MKKFGIGDVVKFKQPGDDTGIVVKVLGKKWLKVQIGNIILLEHIDDLINKKDGR
jgi:flagellar motor switch protein FliM